MEQNIVNLQRYREILNADEVEKTWQQALPESLFINEYELISMLLTDTGQGALMQLKQSLDNEFLVPSVLQKNRIRNASQPK